jgi:hypothetical protein
MTVFGWPTFLHSAEGPKPGPVQHSPVGELARPPNDGAQNLAHCHVKGCSGYAPTLGASGPRVFPAGIACGTSGGGLSDRLLGSYSNFWASLESLVDQRILM